MTPDYLFLVSLYTALRDFLCLLMRMSQVTPEGMKFNVFHDFFFNFVHEVCSVLLPISKVAKAVQAGANIDVGFFVKIRIFIHTFLKMTWVYFNSFWCYFFLKVLATYLMWYLQETNHILSEYGQLKTTACLGRGESGSDDKVVDPNRYERDCVLRTNRDGSVFVALHTHTHTQVVKDCRHLNLSYYLPHPPHPSPAPSSRRMYYRNVSHFLSQSRSA